jgi:methyl-accepting chemotaxis protein
MKKKRGIVGAVAVGILVFSVSESWSGFLSTDWWNKKVAQPVQKEVIKPTEKAFVQLGEDINREIIQPIDFNVIKPTIGVGETVVNIVDMAILIKDMIPSIRRIIDNITAHITTVSHIKNGKDIVDPIFQTMQELTKLPPHFQAILNKVANSMGAIEAIVRPSNAASADKIKNAANEMRSINASVGEMTHKIMKLNEMLHVRVKAIAESANQATNDVLTIIK